MKNSLVSTYIGWFRVVALAEGISYLVLLFIAMPLKYFYGFARAVEYTGWVHGVLFVIYGLLLLKVWIQYRWKFNKVLIAFIAALVPIGTLLLDKKLKKEYFQP
jgi:integral membrane protein